MEQKVAEYILFFNYFMA